MVIGEYRTQTNLLLSIHIIFFNEKKTQTSSTVEVEAKANWRQQQWIHFSLALRIGKRVHCHAVVSGFGLDTYVQAAFVMFYSKCGDMGAAHQVFDRMPEKSIVAWNSLVSGFEKMG
ncbi:Pentatricopeptide repeat-containing protein [Cardamine amara subsp. amara]|uniref:Pentatricopeptide repeat-containing protein n=1 Tax=Cardamine amara subsp. amara TaxID=228776 RepID=A0ABD0ZIU2_CARAN